MVRCELVGTYWEDREGGGDCNGDRGDENVVVIRIPTRPRPSSMCLAPKNVSPEGWQRKQGEVN